MMILLIVLLVLIHWLVFPGIIYHYYFIKMALSYWLRAEVDDLLNEDTFFDISDYSCLLEDTDWA